MMDAVIKEYAPAAVLFCFQAEDGIRDWSVTGVQTCALPIYLGSGAGTLLEAGLGGRRQRGHVGSCELSHGVMVGEVHKFAWRGGVNWGHRSLSQKRLRANR